MIGRTKLNLIANFLGSITVGLIGFLFIPYYLKGIGVAGYGLVGFQTAMVASFALFDLGFGAAGTREMAMLSTKPDFLKNAKNFVLTFEVLYWTFSILLGLFLYFCSPLISQHWLSSQEISPDEVQRAVQLMSIALIFQFPIALYSGCIIGLQKQVGLNLINIAFSVLRYGGAALVIFWTHGSLFHYFLWQIIVSVFNAIIMRSFLWSKIKSDFKPRFNFSEIEKVWKFALAMGGVNLLGLLLNQVDKIIISKMFSLERFGYYTIAWSVASLIYRISSPVFNAIYPRLTQLMALGNEENLDAFFQKASETMALFVIPLSLFLAIFSKEVLTIWLNNPSTVEQTYRTLSYLMIGSMFGGLYLSTYCLQLAGGFTQLVLKVNTFSLFVYAPAIVLFIKFFDQPAYAWILLNLIGISLGAFFTHKVVLKNSLYRWALKSVMIPIGFTLILFFGCKILYLSLGEISKIDTILFLALSGISGFVGTAMISPQIRQLSIQSYGKFVKG